MAMHRLFPSQQEDEKIYLVVREQLDFFIRTFNRNFITARHFIRF